MWVMTSDSFVSIVEHRENPERLIVRARFPEDISRFLGRDVVPAETPGFDYRYRVTVSRAVVASALRRVALEIDYPNFKSSITEGFRKIAAMQTWEAWYDAQFRYHRARIEDDLGVEGCYGGTD